MDPTLLETVKAWRDADLDEGTRAELDALLEKGDASRSELADRFAQALEFGTAGLRGILGAGPNRMNRAVVVRTTLGLAEYLEASDPDAKRRGVVIGRDARQKSEVFARDAAAVLAARGFTVHFFPTVVPTPATAFAVKALGAAAGVMVTASHNPPEYNGYKVYWGNGAQIIPPHDTGIAAAIERAPGAKDIPLLSYAEAVQKGLVQELPRALLEQYLEGVVALRLHGKHADRIRIVYTALHGVGGELMLEALGRAGFTHVYPVPEQQEPDGSFPTVRFPNPEERGAMDLATALMGRTNATLVLANDPDADRLAVIVRDGHGVPRALSGNEVGVLLGHYVLTRTQEKVDRPLVVTTIVSSGQLQEIAKKLLAEFEQTLTGFKWIANRAIAREAEDGAHFRFGYEEALGYTVGTLVRDKDGIGAGLVFADLAAWCEGRGTSVLGYLEEIQRDFGLYLAEQRNFALVGAAGAAAIRGILDSFRKHPPTLLGERRVNGVRDYEKGDKLPPSNVLAFELEGGARITLRPSGTEPKIKYYFELRETLDRMEPVERARARGEERLRVLIHDFLALARERGQP